MDESRVTSYTNRRDDFRSYIVPTGLFLVALGVIGSLYLAALIFDTLSDPMSIPFIAEFEKVLVKAEITVDDKTISINKESALGLSFVFFWMIAMLSISLVSLLFSSGARLLAPDVHRELTRISSHLQKLQERYPDKI